MTTPTPRPPTGGLLAVHAHPDDETLATGGLLAVWADAGRPVTLVTCTRGELGEVIPAELAHLEGDGPALAAWREVELAAAMRRLGVADHVLLDRVGAGDIDGVRDPDPDPDGERYRDSGMAWVGVGRAAGLATLPPDAFVAVPVDAAATRLARVLRDRRPDVVVTYEPGGGYGHPDHVHAHRVAMRAVELAAQDGGGVGDQPPHVVPVVLWAAVADDVLRRAWADLPDAPAVREALARDPRLTLPAPDGPVPSVAVPAGGVDLAVDLTGVLDRVAAALAEHRTQVASIVADVPAAPGGRSGGRSGGTPGDGSGDGPRLAGCYALSNHVLAPLLTHEAYRFAPGYPRGPVTWPGPVSVVGSAAGPVAEPVTDPVAEPVAEPEPGAGPAGGTPAARPVP
jgi:N-acetyl-1-D-myo-inositol-2-amino-2-deoxy-alpha-D-glucopyranoside deacetylase